MKASFPFKIQKKNFRINRLLEYQNDQNSFASKKKSNYVKYLVDGKDYFEDLFQSLMEAKESININGFYLPPELFLLRFVDEKIYKDLYEKRIITKDFGKNIIRLIEIIDYKAKQNIQIYILLYYEWSFALNANSKHARDMFNKLNRPNINLIRFPESQKGLKWSNH